MGRDALGRTPVWWKPGGLNDYHLLDSDLQTTRSDVQDPKCNASDFVVAEYKQKKVEKLIEETEALQTTQSAQIRE
jgi:hypothetical protein